ncbi:MAG: glycine--tRNA ligase subunit beta [Acidobacteriota bacterium]
MTKPDSAPLLVEVGCEEIPDRMLDRGRDDLASAVVALLVDARLVGDADAASCRSFATPRRMAVVVHGVSRRQEERTQEITGPPVSASFDADGGPTPAAIGFAAGHGVAVEDLLTVDGPRGPVLAVRKLDRGRTAAEILAEGLPSTILSLSFAKTMAWGEGGLEFVRPIRWLVVLHGEDVVCVQVAGVMAGRVSQPRRGSSHSPVSLASPAEYVSRLQDAEVWPDCDARRARIQEAITATAEAVGGHVVSDPGLVGIVTNLVEYPGCLPGTIPEHFLELPSEVLTTTLRHHQRCFSVAGPTGDLRGRFVAVVNTPDDTTGAIGRGYERVIEGRLSDARFFYDEDRKQPLANRQELLERTRFHAELGSYADKTRRLARLVSWLGEQVGLSKEQVGQAARAALLSKCDLTTLMENEFPELQGIVGGLYAREDDEPGPVWRAVYDQYRPEGIDEPLPREVTGGLLSVADRLDNLVGLMGVGVVPKGSRDPFALRRAALGLVRILVEQPVEISVADAVDAALAGHGDAVPWKVEPAVLRERVLNFIEGRLRFLFEQRGHRYDSIAAVIAAGWEVPCHAAARLEALTSIRGEDDFEALAAASKRIRNILEQARAAGTDVPAATVDESLLDADVEKELHAAAVAAADRVRRADAARDERAALAAIASLRPQVDRFFDGVMVLTEDPDRRRNRLGLLASVAGLYAGRADFAEIVVEGTS